MTETPIPNQTPPALKWLVQPYAERRILAGFLKREEVTTVYALAQDWPMEVTDRVSALCGVGSHLGPREEAGRCQISVVEEPEVLEILDPASRAIQAGPNASFNFAWVEIENLIAGGAVADPLPPQVSLSEDDLRTIAVYSLHAIGGQFIIDNNGVLLSSTPLNITLANMGINGNILSVQYRIGHVVSPIIVGYEQGRCFLLTEYGRVIHALAQNIKRLVCLVYYGLDLRQADMGMKLQSANGEVFNQFGHDRLKGADAPMVKDFLDPSLAAVVPSRSPVFATQPFLQSLQVSIEPAPQGGLPLSGKLSDDS
jgi:hypothetical protein